MMTMLTWTRWTSEGVECVGGCELFSLFALCGFCCVELDEHVCRAWFAVSLRVVSRGSQLNFNATGETPCDVMATWQP